MKNKMTNQEIKLLEKIKIPTDILIGKTLFKKGCSFLTLINKANNLYDDLDSVFKEFPETLTYLFNK